MRYFRGSRICHVLLLSLTLIALSGCYKWSTVHEPADQAVAGRPDRVRVTTGDGNEIEIQRPRVESDRIIGLSGGDTISVALSDVDRIAERKFDAPLFIGAIVGFSLIGSLIICGGSKDSFEPEGC